MPTISLDVQEAVHLHQTGQAHQLHGNIDSKFIKAAVFGAADGIVTTFAVVSGVTGAHLSPGIILILGFANLIGDGISMGVGDFLGERSEQKFKRYQLAIEKWEIQNIPDEERKELKNFFAQRGVNKEDTETIVGVIAKHPELWVELGFMEEMGEMPGEVKHLWLSGVVTMGGFFFAGMLPLVPYILQTVGISFPQTEEFFLSAFATGCALFLVGGLRTLVTKGSWWRNGLEMLGIGALAAVGAYVTGAVIKMALTKL